MARHIKNLAALPEFSPAMLDDVERVVQLVRPDTEQIEQCRRDVMDAIRMIASLPAYVPPRVVKKRLNDITANLRAARTAINEVPLAWRNLLHVEDNFLSELARLSKKPKN